MITYFYVFLTIALTVYGQIVIKARATIHSASAEGVGFLSAMFLDPWVLSGLAAALTASATWMMAVRGAELSVVYPIMALTFIAVPVLAVVIFGERLSGLQMAGLFLIVIGVSLAAVPR